MILFRVFLTILVLISCATSYADCARFFGFSSIDTGQLKPEELQKEVRKIYRMIMTKTRSSGGELNMDIIENLFRGPESNGFLGFGNNKRLVAAKKLLLSLKELGNERFCGKLGYRILVDVTKAMDSEPVMPRMVSIMRHFVGKHQSTCSHIYTKMLDDKLAKMDAEKLEKLESLFENTMKYTGLGMKVDTLFSLIKMDQVGPSEENLTKSLTNTLGMISSEGNYEEDMDSGKVIQDMFERTSRSYLVEPCNHYIENLGEDIFEPNLAMISTHMFNSNEPQFYRSWAKYMFRQNAFKVIKASVS